MNGLQVNQCKLFVYRNQGGRGHWAVNNIYTGNQRFLATLSFWSAPKQNFIGWFQATLFNH